jgi:microcystin-dependent protein
MEPLLGQIELLPYNFVPTQWMACSGQLMPINQNQALFSLLGTTYGGDGRTTFALPNLQGKAPAANLQYCIAIQGVYPSRS